MPVIHFILLSALVGFYTISTQILCARFLTPIFGGNEYTWAATISSTLMGLSIGILLGSLMVNKFSKLNVNLLIGILWAAIGVMSAALAFFGPNIAFAFRQMFQLEISLIVSSLILCFPLNLLFGATTQVLLENFFKCFKRNLKWTGYLAAINCFGSLSGALVTIFIFLSHSDLGSKKSFLLLGIVALSVGVAFVSRYFITAVLFSFAISFAMLNYWQPHKFIVTQPANVLEESENIYGVQQVLEFDSKTVGQKIRAYYIPAASLIQTGVLAKDLSVPAHYQGMLAPYWAFLLTKKIETAVSLGIAGGSFARDLAKIESISKIYAVDINPQSFHWAKRYFDFPADSAKLLEVQEDARVFIRSLASESVDFIYSNVAEGGGGYPSHLFSKEYFSDVARVLSKNGVLTIQTIGRVLGENSVGEHMNATLKAAFPGWDIVLVLPNALRPEGSIEDELHNPLAGQVWFVAPKGSEDQLIAGSFKFPTVEVNDLTKNIENWRNSKFDLNLMKERSPFSDDNLLFQIVHFDSFRDLKLFNQ